MSKKDVYKTVKKQSQSLLIEKKSKFIANVKPVDNEDDALAFLNEIRSKYSDATHNVYAYVIDENNIFRYSDDGEPSGTAGMPVLDAIRKSGIVDVVVVVTRYFGGTLLGTGGLVHTYGASAKQGLIESIFSDVKLWIHAVIRQSKLRCIQNVRRAEQSFRQVRQQVFLRLWNLGIMTKSVTAVKV